MNILWATRTRVLGGAERATLVLTQQLRARGHHIDVLCRRGGPLAAAAAAAGLPLHRGRSGPAALARALRARPPQTVLITSIDDWLSACLAKAAGRGARLVLVRHMALPVSWPLRWLADRHADAVVAVSHAVRDRLGGRAGIRPERLHVIHNPTRFPIRAAVPTAIERASARARLGLPVGGRWIAYLGGRVAAKGPADALAAVRQADATLGNVRLVACGPGPRSESPWIGAADLVHALGAIEPVDVLLTAADALLVPTQRRLSEAMPLTVIEAMACGTPVIAYAVGGVPEALGSDGDAGRLVEPDDPTRLGAALIDVLRNPADAQAMTARALARAAALFDPERIADQYEALFRGLPLPRGGGPG